MPFAVFLLCHKQQPGFVVQICGFRYIFDGNNLVEYDENAGKVHIEIKGLNTTVRTSRFKNRTILKDINIVIEPQEMVAILGASGAGKSTLLGALTGTRPATSGEILVNGRNLYKEFSVFQLIMGYVPQDDIVHLDLTVREALTYSAFLRMPYDSSEEEIRHMVEEVMNELELTECSNLRIKNLSGGQRKRVSIGVELLTKPGLFFLDEATSGLDPGLERVMMELLRKLADGGRTILLATHATLNIGLCDKVIFLTRHSRNQKGF
ncbi:ATP-binding cassette domain-containing protein [Syntrophomonas wolfei]|uniref:ATP-binding cassette domain-containing protein n=1 Tax=Syntrophomonas wolfei TaxID=863 RepID=UPI0023F3EE42|nr:ATP-binding cassette domain-containing protein [Syntrophomonas wolfei]